MVGKSIKQFANIKEVRRLIKSEKQPIILQLIREGKPKGEFSMLLFLIRTEIRERLILSPKLFENKNQCMRYKAKLLKR